MFRKLKSAFINFSQRNLIDDSAQNINRYGAETDRRME